MCSKNTFKNKVTRKVIAYKSNIYKRDLILNNPQGLIRHKTPTSQPFDDTCSCPISNLLKRKEKKKTKQKKPEKKLVN